MTATKGIRDQHVRSLPNLPRSTTVKQSLGDAIEKSIHSAIHPKLDLRRRTGTKTWVCAFRCLPVSTARLEQALYSISLA